MQMQCIIFRKIPVSMIFFELLYSNSSIL